MGWEKASEATKAAFAAALPDDPRIERRVMFGYPCAFVNGQMFTGTHEQNIVVRLPEAERAKLLRQDGAAPFVPMPGRPMKEYVAVPPAMLDKPARLRGWMDKALAYAASLPPKEKKRPAKRKPPPG